MTLWAGFKQQNFASDKSIGPNEELQFSQLSTSTTSGSDLLAYRLLTHLPSSVQQHLLSFFNWSWSSHTFPSNWNPATIFPIHKPADSLASCNPNYSHLLYIQTLRAPGSQSPLLLPSVQNVISPTQAGFRPGRSTIDQVLILSQSI